jgi:hypothetical protein
MAKCTDYPLPGVGQTIFYVMTVGGIFTLSTTEQQLQDGFHDFSPLFYAGHYVIGKVAKTRQKSEDHLA